MPDEDSLSTKARRTPWNKGKLMSESPGQSGHALPIGHQPLRAMKRLMHHSDVLLSHHTTKL